jgi:putative two-component system response regulator
VSNHSLSSVLIVDDEPGVRDVMARWASSLSLDTKTAGSADEALETLRSEPCDLAFIDVMMPGRDGLWLANELKREHPQTALVLATGHASRVDGEPSARAIADLLIKPFARDRFLMAVDRGRQWRKETLEELRWNSALAAELQSGIEKVAVALEERFKNGENEEEALLAMADERTGETMAHAERVLGYALSVARVLGIDPAAMPLLEGAARFHDVGKMAIPDCLLNKPSPLTQGEQAIMRRHVDAGADILASTRALRDLAPLVLATHEWFGGGGYPRNLQGDSIPLASRIIAVVDAYDAMTQDRHYRTRLGPAESIAELLRCSGSQFDPGVVGAFLTVLGIH